MSDQLIIVDWGTTAFRAWLIEAESGTILAEIPDGLGMRALAREEFAAYANKQLAPWRNTPVPVYMAGMVGAPQGWQWAPQPPLPLGLSDIAQQIVPVTELDNAFIIPGVSQKGAPQDADVIRGEEVQIWGALELTGRQSATLCLPGTHSKWAQVEAGTFTHFATAMTGEVYEVMLEHSILGLMANKKAPFNLDAFVKGLEQAEHAGGLLHHLFTARSRVLAKEIAEPETASYLSGLLIGSELTGLIPSSCSQQDEILLVCAEQLAKPYEIALSRAGYLCRHITSRDATLCGVRAVARMHNPALQ
ncbi:2-dehydro-3-deoxygalactonokinase [Cohaesibacter celericrescens]|uniref:2-dehydro-3-deoxygalactonokinase n=1 Tax=Cohaesibacter celericrescens TaxID=2067669 RepID=A0A2N5XLE3_9HYPH|nr:2-dehydro-3-deoxygalactonokinase [Cohaesibacter celericrescens]PLW75314.1 2-dehydro-3-deoxygalactonokinase [Cohaesibacter celericrescens]